MFVLDQGSRIVVPRTEMTYPGHNMRMHENAAGAPVDHVMADLEERLPLRVQGGAIPQYHHGGVQHA